MSDIAFTEAEKSALVAKLQDYFRDELEVELSQFPAEFLLEFISKELGPSYYNRGLHDAQALLMRKVDDLTDAIYQLEKVDGITR